MYIFVVKRFNFEYFSYFCNKYRRRIVNGAAMADSLSAGWRCDFRWKYNTALMLLVISGNLGNSQDI